MSRRCCFRGRADGLASYPAAHAPSARGSRETIQAEGEMFTYSNEPTSGLLWMGSWPDTPLFAICANQQVELSFSPSQGAFSY